MAKDERIGLLGGTFNPIHNGHLRAAIDCAEKLALEKIVFIPSFLPPHKGLDADVPALHRMEMIRRAISGRPNLEVSDSEIARGGESYTYDTLCAFRQARPGARFHFILGIDAYRDIASWFRFGEILDLADWVVITRPGYRLPDIAGPLASQAGRFRKDGTHSLVGPKSRITFIEVRATDVSSSEVRNAVRSGKSIASMVPSDVAEYIARNELYR